MSFYDTSVSAQGTLTLSINVNPVGGGGGVWERGGDLTRK